MSKVEILALNQKNLKSLFDNPGVLLLFKTQTKCYIQLLQSSKIKIRKNTQAFEP